MSNWVIWGTEIKPNYATVGGLANVPDPHELQRGVSRADGFPSTAVFKMDPKRPKGVKLPDNMHNLPRLVLLSQALKDAIAATKPPRTEYLPVQIMDHKGRQVPDPYFIVNQVGLQDCIDVDASEVVWNRIEPDLISSCDQLVIKESKIDPKLSIFRLKHLPTVVLVRRSLADELLESDATGLEFDEIEDFGG